MFEEKEIKLYCLQLAEDNMNEVLNSSSSTYTEQVEAINEFFDTW